MRFVVLTVGILVAVMGIALFSSMDSTAAQSTAQGCPSCHGAAGREPALNAVAKAIKSHPAIPATTVSQCLMCHEKGPSPAPFRQVMHKIHLNSTKFVTKYKGTCTNCHNVDKATGTVTVYGIEK